MTGSQPRPAPVTIADVARHAGVSTAVVSRLVNNDQALSVRDETRARVMAAIESLGYRPNATARSLRRSRMDAFGLITRTDRLLAPAAQVMLRAIKAVAHDVYGSALSVDEPG